MSWALREESLEALDRRLSELEPKIMVEAGSGESTAVLSKHGYVVSLEHLPRYAMQTRALAPQAEIRLCKLKPFFTLAGTFQWYDTQLPGNIDFALIDGPPGHIGRGAALFALWPYLSADWEIWLDDADRLHESKCLDLWAQHFAFDLTFVNRWVARLRPTLTVR